MLAGMSWCRVSPCARARRSVSCVIVRSITNIEGVYWLVPVLGPAFTAAVTPLVHATSLSSAFEEGWLIVEAQFVRFTYSYILRQYAICTSEPPMLHAWPMAALRSGR